MEYRAGGQLRLSVIVFLTLQHRVVVGGKLGPLHSHSCSVEIELSPPRGDTIPFAEIEAEIKAQIIPLDGKTLNDLANFQGINPSVENFAAHLYNRLSLITAEYGAVLHSVTVRESPTRAVKYLRDTAYVMTAAWDGDEERKPGQVVRLPVSPPENAEIDNVRRLRAPVEHLPLSPNQRPSSDFQPAEMTSPEATGTAEPVARESETVAEKKDDSSEPPPASPGVPPAAPTSAPPSVQLAEQRSTPQTQLSPAAASAKSNPGYPPQSLEGLPSRKNRKDSGGKSKPVPAEPVTERDSMPRAVGGMQAVAAPKTTPSRKAEKPTLPEPEEGDDSEMVTPFLKRPVVLTSLILLVFLGATAFLYRRILWPPPGQGYPWGSDTWGHIKKAEFLLREIRLGDYFPKFSPLWYSGDEPFRYWAPLPYYVLAGLITALRDSFLATGWYIGLSAFIGGAGWLLFRKRLGLAGSILAGLAWIFWQDQIRVALGEGNLPRVLATAIFPWFLHFFLATLEARQQAWIKSMAVLAGLSAILVLSHAMIAAMFFVTAVLLGILWGLWQGVKVPQIAHGVVGIVSGIGLSSWWLIPSLQGGIVAMDSEAMTESLLYLPVQTSFNPQLRLANPEVFYWGVSLVVVIMIVLLTWRNRNSLSKAALVMGIILVAVTTPALKPLYNSIPFHELMWPIRMSTVAFAFFLFSALSFRSGRADRRRVILKTVAVAVVVMALVVDSYPSFQFVIGRAEPDWLRDVVSELPRTGWRTAVLDLSTFGSAATYILADQPGRELTFGWASQGATTMPALVELNVALQHRDYAYLFDRLIEMGVTQVVVRRELVDEDAAVEAASAFGFGNLKRVGAADLLTRDAGPYALRSDYPVLVIGKFAPNWVRLYPSIAIGEHEQIDSYSLADLADYSTVVISGAVWSDRTQAEDLISRYAASGGKVVVDLEGLPEDVLSKRPVFMGVTGEPVLIYKSPSLTRVSGGIEVPMGNLGPLDSQHYPWKALVPQGVDQVDISFPHLGELGTILGSKQTGAGTIWFVGANLPYHAYLTKDPQALAILTETLGIAPSVPPKRTSVPMTKYSASAQGYTFDLEVPEGAGDSPVTIPVAARENTVVKVDGVETKFSSMHTLLSLRLDPGPHQVEIVPLYPESMRPAAFISLGSFAFLSIMCLSLVSVRIAAVAKKRVVTE